MAHPPRVWFALTYNDHVPVVGHSCEGGRFRADLAAVPARAVHGETRQRDLVLVRLALDHVHAGAGVEGHGRRGTGKVSAREGKIV